MKRSTCFVLLCAVLAGCSNIPVVGGSADVATTDAINDLGMLDIPVAADVPPDLVVEVDIPVIDITDVTDIATDGLAPGTCRADSDCATAAEGSLCDTATNRCVQCTAARDLCPAGQYCESNRCQVGCRNDEACASLTTMNRDAGMALDGSDGAVSGRMPSVHCEPTTRTCVECVTNTHCSAGNLCVGNVCVAGCNAERACPTGLTCCAGACIDPQANIANCGTCGRRCTGDNAVPACLNGNCTISMCVSPFEDCDGMVSTGCEIDTRTNLMHCGACGRACAPRSNTNVACEAGTCRYTCAEGFADCDDDPTNGCEANTRTNTLHCGMCGRRCDPPNATAACVMGSCTLERCNASFGDCDGNATNGCETDLRVAVLHCGMCGRSCPSQTNASPTCVLSTCATVCTSGFQDCDGMASNGCEADLRTSIDHCGSCGRACRPAGGTGICMAGSCTVSMCDMGRADCDMNPSNGCETDTRTDLRACGGCGTACPARSGATTTCTMGTCGFTCETGRADCNMMATDGCEVDTRSDTAHCGGCGRACAARANATASCTSGGCVYACNAGFADCDGNPANGCEVDLRTSTSHCGGCGRVCTVMGGTASCMGGSCSVSMCDTGRADCDANAANGCETNIASNVAACGACGTVCPARAGATTTCAMGTCGFTCTTGLADCNMVAADGCEVDTRNNVTHCGGCGRTCAARANATASCTGGSCMYACTTGFADCDGDPANGCEVNLTNTVASCGACGRMCSAPNATSGCSGGMCTVASCNAGFANCDGNPANGCEISTASNPAACGGCGIMCPARAGATATCAAGSCGFVCVADLADCNMMAADGCEIDTRNNVSHCGGCGRACAARANATASCTSGGCVYACNAGFADCDGNPANGCEVNLASNVASCGACGRACSTPNATPACSGGMCTIASCNAGFANCDGNPTNGCEAALDTDSAHCGACGRRCPDGQTCYAGRCSITCGDRRALAPAGCTNIAPSGNAFASSSYVASSTPPFANDGNLCTAWNSGGHAVQWWAVDLGAVRTFRGVTLVAEMLPNGNVNHTIEVSNSGSAWMAVRPVVQFMATGALYSFDLGSVTARYVRILSNGSPSWIAWREVAVYTCP